MSHRTDYVYKSRPTIYAGVLFRSRLEARWAAFFDLAGWKWEYEPLDLRNWTPDFMVTFPCRHSDCDGSHTLLVEVKPYFHLGDFKGHPCLNYDYGRDAWGAEIPADASAAFGINPGVTNWVMGHGSGGGDECVENWVENAPALWVEAGNRVMYRKPEKPE